MALGLGLAPVASNAIAYSVGIANSFYWNKRWTFADRPGGSVRATGVRFLFVNLVGLIITSVVVHLLEPADASAITGIALSRAVWLNVVEATAIACALLWNFSMSSLWVFSSRRGAGEMREAQPEHTPGPQSSD